MSFQLKLIIFIISSAGFVWVSWRSLRDFRSHGFYRFFAFEAVAVLILLNLNYWFDEPFSVIHIISWCLLLISLFLVIHGALLLYKIGKPDSERVDPALMSIEKTTVLVKKGAYRYIRHPLYSSLFFGTWGVFFKNLSQTGLILSVIISILVTITAKMEEAENLRFFDEEYRNYIKETKMFIPFLF